MSGNEYGPRQCALCGEPAHRQMFGTRGHSPIACVNTLRARVKVLELEVRELRQGLRDQENQARASAEAGDVETVYDKIWLQVLWLRERDLEPWYVILDVRDYAEAKSLAPVPLQPTDVDTAVFGLPCVVYVPGSPPVRLHGSPYVHAKPR